MGNAQTKELQEAAECGLLHHASGPGSDRTINTDQLFVFCSKKGGCGGAVRTARARVRCQLGHEFVELENGRSIQEEVQTVGDLRMLLDSRSPLRVHCHEGCKQTRGIAYLKCGECQSRSCDGECVWLDQVIAAGAEQECCVTCDIPEDGMLVQFEPCQHAICLEAFQDQVKSLIANGEARNMHRSPVTGHWACLCPMHPADCNDADNCNDCHNSFVHDLHHYKICGAKEYEFVKQFGTEAAFDRRFKRPPPPLPEGMMYLPRDPRCKFILSIDGGGIRGLIAALILEEIEAQLNVRGASIKSSFDLIVGTSTGGIIALGLGATDMTPEDMTVMYEQMGDDIFSGCIPMARCLRGYKYSSKSLEEVLKMSFTDTAQLSASIDSGPRVCVTSVCADTGTPFMFRNYGFVGDSPHEGTDKARIWEVIEWAALWRAER